MVAVSEQSIAYKKQSGRKIPHYLVWEVLDGQPLYRRGYKFVIKKQKTLEDIMGTSSYQSLINSYFLKLLFQNLDLTKYDLLTNEIGVHIGDNDNFSHDIAIYKRLENTQFSKKYTDYPAQIVIEIDINIDPDIMHDLEYLTKKTQKLLDFGVEKVFWVLTNIKKIIIATPNNPWLTIDWHKNIEITDGITFNIQEYLDKRGIEI